MIKHKGITIKLGDTDYVFAPLTLGAIESLQEKLSKLDGNFSLKDASIVVDMATASLKRNYVDVKREDVAELIDISNMQDVFLAIMNISEMKSQDKTEGNSEEKK